MTILGSASIPAIPIAGMADATMAAAEPPPIALPSHSSVSAHLNGTGEVDRSVLTNDEQMLGFDFDSPVNEEAFALPEEAVHPEHVFEGRLETTNGAQMLGVSGNVVILMPNGSTYYYFSDNMEFTWDDALRESNKIARFCK